MRSTEFCYWLQGYFEISGSDSSLNEERVKCIKNYLNLVFEHEIDPSYGEDREYLQKIYDGEEEEERKDQEELRKKFTQKFPRGVRPSSDGGRRLMC